MVFSSSFVSCWVYSATFTNLINIMFQKFTATFLTKMEILGIYIYETAILFKPAPMNSVVFSKLISIGSHGCNSSILIRTKALLNSLEPSWNNWVRNWAARHAHHSALKVGLYIYSIWEIYGFFKVENL